MSRRASAGRTRPFPHPLTPYTELIVNFCPTGMIPTKAMTPHVPVSPGEVVEQACEALDRGIAIVHLHARDEDGEPLSDKELRDELVTLLVAGHETTATSLAWTLERITRNPEVLARLEDDPGGEYLDAVIKEALRLRPVVPAVAVESTVEKVAPAVQGPAVGATATEVGNTATTVDPTSVVEPAETRDVDPMEWVTWSPLIALTVVFGVAPGLLLVPVSGAVTAFLGGL